MKITLTEPVLNFYQTATPPCVSIYCPTHRSGPETRQDPIRLKNLLRRASEGIAAHGFGEQADEILRPMRDLLPDIDFWTHQQEGLALFASPGQFRYFHLPYPIPEQAFVSDRFLLKPLLPLFSRDDIFYILTLNISETKLYEANRYSIRHLEVPGLPESMAEVLQYDEGEVQLQHWSFGPTIGAKGSAHGAHGGGMFHGHGGEKDVRRDQLLRYFRAIDGAVRRYLNDSNEPLVLAGVDHYFSIYRDANSYPFLIDEGVSGGTESFSEDELREKAWTFARPHVNQAQRKMLERFDRVAYNNGNGATKATRRLENTVAAAREGRIDALAIPRQHEVWGEINQDSGEVRRGIANSTHSRELMDYAAMQTVLYGGELFILPDETMPHDSEVAALLRYSSGLRESA